VRARANELLADRGDRAIGHLTPHTLRRTFASILAEVGVAPRRAMYLLGHTDPRFTMRVYEQVFDAGPQTVAQLEMVLGLTRRGVCDLFGAAGFRTETGLGAENTSRGGRQLAPKQAPRSF
jgi:Phage integrase family